MIESKKIFPEKSLSVHMFVCLSVPSVPSVPSRPVPEKKSLKQKILLNKVVRYTSRVTKKYSESCCGAGRGEAKLRIFDFKTTWLEIQIPSQTAPAGAKPRCVYSILKPHGQSSITSPESVPSSCVRQHT